MGIFGHRKKAAAVAPPEWTVIAGGPIAGHRMLLSLDAAPWQREMQQGVFDSFIYQALATDDLTGKVVWDVGAHVGYHTLCFAALAGDSGKSVAFEPNPHNIARLQENINGNPALASRVQVVPVALSETAGEEQMVFSASIDDGSSSGSGLESAFALAPDINTDGVGRIAVKTARADALVERGEISAPDVMKIDVEGAEHFVLRGTANVLREKKPLLIIEVHNITAMFHLQNLLIPLGYRSEMLDPEHSSSSRCHIIARPQ